MFQFKQFTVQDDRCAMKVGTDGVLLGAWARVEQAKTALDLGTGSGLISLMLAQRNPNCRLVGVEREVNACMQARENVGLTPWAERIEIIQADVLLPNLKIMLPVAGFDLVVANPPYFTQGVACRDLARDQARYLAEGEHSHLTWLKVAESCLNQHGCICFILPFVEGKRLLAQLSQTSLYCAKECQVVTKVGKAPQRVLLEFRHKRANLDLTTQRQQIVLYDQANHYHPDVLPMLQPFYLKL
ncbi:tRNA (adenosine(37)-N6)-methyltransferase TrmM [Mergibacter septicus]|uniref:tRNA1(Val) (adenine(37)-N6)-methyltransferase n=1 Tax=Mergibacter septicus TaxID=221402 RepID=UPI001C771F3B|nr:tRNA1(Val) (adenine(37)-N6)-methyltransferase [Mergibacter septicus]QDJ13625.1 tRNA (adenosine(37)-N6)-methyltransferase TrmM [Mergibacter septicus]